VTVEVRLKTYSGLLENILNEVTVGFTAVFDVVKEFATLGKNHRAITAFTTSHYWFPL
jgi:hypothetical protein